MSLRADPAPDDLYAATCHAGVSDCDAGMLDTWNVVGQILMRLDGVTYGRL